MIKVGVFLLKVLSTAEEIFSLRNKFVVFNLVLRNLKLRYRKSALGIFWTTLIPAFTALVYYFVFQFIMKVSIPNYLLFILSGLIPWTFFSQTITSGLESIVGNHGILNKVPISANVFPLSESLTALINLVFSIPVVVLVAIVTNAPFSLNWMYAFPLLLLLLLQAYFLGLICAVIFVYFRDFRHIIGIVLQVWFYLTPVIYRPEMMPNNFRWIVGLNPVGYIFHGLHSVIVFGDSLNMNEILLSSTWTLVIGVAATLLYMKQKRYLVEHL